MDPKIDDGVAVGGGAAGPSKKDLIDKQAQPWVINPRCALGLLER